MCLSLYVVGFNAFDFGCLGSNVSPSCRLLYVDFIGLVAMPLERSPGGLAVTKNKIIECTVKAAP